jgi:hypothetical protein
MNLIVLKTNFTFLLYVGLCCMFDNGCITVDVASSIVLHVSNYARSHTTSNMQESTVSDI